MKTPAMIFAGLALVSVLSAGEVAVGSSGADVLSALGEPRGEAWAGARQILYFERGTVELRDGIVTRVALISEEKNAQRRAAAEQMRAENEARQARLNTEGEALKTRKLADSAFNAAPQSYQVAFWEDFARKYPGVPCSEELVLARLRLADELEQRRIEEERESRLAELEARVAAAEARAREAETRSYGYAGYYPYFGRPRYNPASSLWPIKYNFGDATTMEPPARTPGLMPGSLRDPPARTPGLMPGSLRDPPARSPGLMRDDLRIDRTPAVQRSDRDDCDEPRGRHVGSHRRSRPGPRI